MDVLEIDRHHEHTGDTSDEEVFEEEEETTAETPEVKNTEINICCRFNFEG